MQTQKESFESVGTATYDPDDNKLRLYPFHRLDKEDYNTLKSAGFTWAPKQEVFVAPMWTPGREDILITLCGEIEDDDRSLIDRAEERRYRFADYSEKRQAEADQAHSAVQRLCDQIPLGQPILVGHHSEKRARKHAQQIERGMERAVKAFKTSEYWAMRAAGVIRHAEYKDRADVRARRIKKIEADKRKAMRTIDKMEKLLKLWCAENLTREAALKICNYLDHSSASFPLNQYPREAPASQYEGPMSLWSAIEDGIITHEQARDMAIPRHRRTAAHCLRWVEHYDHRLEYERALLDAQGGADLLKPKPKSKKQTLPLCNYRAPEGIRIENQYHKGEFSIYPQVEMTKSEYAAIYKDYKGTKIIDGTHKVRTAMVKMSLVSVFLTDSKTHEIPEAAPNATAEPAPAAPAPRPVRQRAEPSPDKVKYQQMEETLKQGVQTVCADQLFETPRHVAEEMAELCDVQPGHNILEPSAGTGMLLGALGCRMFDHNPESGSVSAVEINPQLCDRLAHEFQKTQVINADFLEWRGGEFDRIIMNPPFKNGVDIQHIKHAESMLKPGGVLVALCANGPRQQAEFRDRCDKWRELPAGTFKNTGTMVNVALLVIRKW